MVNFNGSERYCELLFDYREKHKMLAERTFSGTKDSNGGKFQIDTFLMECPPHAIYLAVIRYFVYYYAYVDNGRDVRYCGRGRRRS